jgi:hypothetical protein
MFKTFSYGDAMRLYMDARYGPGGWVGELAPNQQDLLSRYPPDSPGPGDPQARAEWERAVHHDGMARIQREKAAFWLRSSGFNREIWFDELVPEALKERIEDALASDFGRSAPPLPTVLLKLPISPPTGADIASRPAQAEDGTGDAVPPANDLRPAPDPKLEEKSRSAADPSPIPTKPGGEAALGNKRPTGGRGPVPTAEKIKDAARPLIANGCIPGKTIPWDQFHIRVCNVLNVKPSDRGYGLDTIQRAVRSLLSGTEKTENTES